ncbi:MAG TPA: hypothetical protein VNX01_14780 [Bacteroidia bacterium]|jgi:hypothetical protein|nr:hypothetical protein [Bacteroidia bacterium]
MLFISDEGNVYYYISEIKGEVFYDLYNFFTMGHTEQASQSIINWNAQLFKLKKYSESSNVKFDLILDFHSNIRVPVINVAIDNFEKYFKEMSKITSIAEMPLILKVHSLTLEEIILVINDSKFQSLNVIQWCSTWWVKIGL